MPWGLCSNSSIKVNLNLRPSAPCIPSRGFCTSRPASGPFQFARILSSSGFCSHFHWFSYFSGPATRFTNLGVVPPRRYSSWSSGRFSSVFCQVIKTSAFSSPVIQSGGFSSLNFSTYVKMSRWSRKAKAITIRSFLPYYVWHHKPRICFSWLGTTGSSSDGCCTDILLVLSTTRWVGAQFFSPLMNMSAVLLRGALPERHSTPGDYKTQLLASDLFPQRVNSNYISRFSRSMRWGRSKCDDRHT